MVTLETSTIIRAPIERCFDLARSVEVHLAANAQYGETTLSRGLMEMGQRVPWRARHFGVWQHLTSEITAMNRPEFFQAPMAKGIFRSMQQDHRFLPIAQGKTEVKDVFRFAAPLPALGRLAEALFLRRYMTRLLLERTAAIQHIAESDEWKRYLTP